MPVRAALTALGAAALVPFVLAAWGPLRLNDDGVVYLSMARSIVTGRPYTPPAVNFPKGYPALLAVLQWLHVDRRWTFVLLNIVFLALALACSYLVLRSALGLGSLTAAAVCVALLVEHELVTLTPTPVSDVVFFGVAMLVVLLAERSCDAPRRRAVALIACSAVLALAGVEIRSAGVALFAPVAVTLLRRLHGRRAVAVGYAALAGGVAVAIAAVVGTGYGGHIRAGWHASDGVGGILSQVPSQLQAKLDVVAAVVVNIAPDHWPAALHWAMPATGAAALAAVFAGMAVRRRFGPAEAFFAAGVLVLAVWPENSARLLIPLLALAGGYLVVEAEALWHRRSLRALAVTWAAAFAIAGVAAAAHSLVLTYSGASFPSRWKENRSQMTASYRIAYGQLTTKSGVPYDHDALRLLLRYDRH